MSSKYLYSFKLVSLTMITMIAFAANSLFCRLALADQGNDPLSFTLVRLLSGAIILSFFLFKYRSQNPLKLDMKSILAPAMLFSYALFFSLSYVRIGAGIGALILFSCVQLTMLATAFFRGQTLSGREKSGVALAICGFVYLLLPGIDTPPLMAAALMAIAGLSWGSLFPFGPGGRQSDPFDGEKLFSHGTPCCFANAIFPLKLSDQGFAWAILSGSVTSGLGYVLWYLILKDLSTSTAAIVQLSVPALAAFGGILFLGENIKTRLIFASILILGGIFIKVNEGFHGSLFKLDDR